MLKKYIKFYMFVLFIILSLIFLFFNKMNSTYEAKYNFKVFNYVSSEFLKHTRIEAQQLKLKNQKDIHIEYKNNFLVISIKNNDYRKCLKYGVDYMDSNFTSITINDILFTRRDLITRDIILDKCNKTFNNIILTEKMEK